MTFGIAPLVIALLTFGQPTAAPTPTPPPVTPVPPVRGDKEFDPPTAFNKKVPETIDDLKAIEGHVRLLTKKVIPATVGIRIGASSGSGVIIDAEGHVLTAGHVSGKPNQDCQIILQDGRVLKGKTLGANQGIDSGLIKISDKGEFPHVEMAKSADLKRGDWCLAIGHPGGFQKGRTPVVRLGRVLESRPDFLRTDCTLVGGDSGGPLFNMTGKVIGIHSRIGKDITQNIHVPVDTYRETFDKLVKAEVWGPNRFAGPPLSYLGAGFDRKANSCKVTTISPESPADKIGLKVDDLILKFDGQPMNTPDDLFSVLRKRRPAETVSIEVRRGDEVLQLRVVLAKPPQPRG